MGCEGVGVECEEGVRCEGGRVWGVRCEGGRV